MRKISSSYEGEFPCSIRTIQYINNCSKKQQMIYHKKFKKPSYYNKSYFVFDFNCPLTVKFPLSSMIYCKFLQHSYVEVISKLITPIIVRSCVVQNRFIFPSVSSQPFS